MLTDLANGNHTLRVYSHDALGVEMSGYEEFSVALNGSHEKCEGFGNILLAVIVAVVVAVLLLLLVWVLRKKRPKEAKVT